MCVCSVLRVAMVRSVQVATDMMGMLLVIVMVIMMMTAESCLLRMRLYNQYLSYISPDSDEAYLQNTTGKKPSLQQEQTCGKSQSVSQNHILGGRAVSYGQSTLGQLFSPL